MTLVDCEAAARVGGILLGTGRCPENTVTTAYILSELYRRLRTSDAGPTLGRHWAGDAAGGVHGV